MAHKHAVTDNPKQLIAVASIAGIFGALTGVLFAPKAGSETRQEMRRQAARTRRSLNQQYAAIKNKGQLNTLDENIIGDNRADTIDHINSIKDTVAQKIDVARDEIDHIRKHGEQ